MTDEDLVGWFFDSSPRLNAPVAGLDPEIRDLIRGAYVYQTVRKPDVVEAIRAHRAQVDQLNAQLDGVL